MQSTIHTMQINRLSEYIHFVHSHHETQDKKPVPPPSTDTRKYPTVQGVERRGGGVERKGKGGFELSISDIRGK